MFVFKTFLKTFQKMLDIIFRYDIMVLSSEETHLKIWKESDLKNVSRFTRYYDNKRKWKNVY